MASIETGASYIGAILRDGKSYNVPEFQRDYSWENEQIEQLWEDLQASLKSKDNDYFLGSMVINDGDKSDYKIIDGQQRLTTISVLICVFRDIAERQDQKHLATSLSRDFLGKYKYGNKETTPKLTLNSNNRDYYEENIFGGKGYDLIKKDVNSRLIKKSDRKLANCYAFLFEAIEEEVNNGKKLDDIVGEIVDALDNSVQVIKITVKDDYDAYLLFETLNDRGLELSVADLLKNYLFSKAGERLNQIQENWRTMSLNLRQVEVKRYLRHFWLANYSVVRDKQLYKVIREHADTKQKVLDLSKRLKESSEFYAALSDKDHNFWLSFDSADRSKIKTLIAEMSLFGVNQYNPLLLAVVEANRAIFSEVLEMVVSFAFRYSIILGSGTGNIEKTFTRAAQAVRNKGSESTALDVYLIIDNLYPNDQEFITAFSEKSVNQSDMARYILRKIDDYLEKDSAKQIKENGKDVNLEHILPQKFNTGDWSGFFVNSSDEKIDDYINRIGNMTLLHNSINKSVANKGFREKKNGGYLKSDRLKISEDVFDSDEWTSEKIIERQRRLAAIAAKIWRIEVKSS